MKIAAAGTSQQDQEQAVLSCWNTLVADLDGEAPDLVFASFSEPYVATQVARQLNDLSPKTRFLGVTSCRGVIVTGKIYNQDGFGFGLLGLRDPKAAFGVGIKPCGDQPRQAAALAVQAALADCGRIGEVPSLIWVSSSPGSEEQVLAGIADVVGSKVPVVGGTAADNNVAGNWSLICGAQVLQDGVTIAVMFPQCEPSQAFLSGYRPFGPKGIVTKTAGREILEIDGRPSGDVYQEWIKGELELSQDEDITNCVKKTAIMPLGCAVDVLGDIPYYMLAHPLVNFEQRSLTVFAEIPEGAEVHLMHGTLDSMISRAGRVCEAAINDTLFTSGDIVGGIGVYCAGCMMWVGNEIDKVAASIDQAMGGKPFLCAFTFGEEGFFVDQCNRHGNLMVSMAVFRKSEDAGDVFDI